MIFILYFIICIFFTWNLDKNWFYIYPGSFWEGEREWVTEIISDWMSVLAIHTLQLTGKQHSEWVVKVTAWQHWQQPSGPCPGSGGGLVLTLRALYRGTDKSIRRNRQVNTQIQIIQKYRHFYTEIQTNLYRSTDKFILKYRQVFIEMKYVQVYTEVRTS